MKKTTDLDTQAALDAWADKIAALESDVAAGVAAYAGRLAADRRLTKDDRQFAAAQADAIRRAVRRAKAKAPAKLASKKPARKAGRKS